MDFNPVPSHDGVVGRLRKFRKFDEPEKKSEPFHSFFEYRGAQIPPANLGNAGDVFLNTDSSKLYLRESEGQWVRWDSSIRKTHPQFPNRFLWIRHRQIEFLSLTDLRKTKIIDQSLVLKSVVALHRNGTGKRKAEGLSLNSKRGKKGRLSGVGLETGEPPSVSLSSSLSISAPVIQSTPSQTPGASSSHCGLASGLEQSKDPVGQTQRDDEMSGISVQDFPESEYTLMAPSVAPDNAFNTLIPNEDSHLQLQSPPPTPFLPDVESNAPKHGMDYVAVKSESSIETRSGSGARMETEVSKSAAPAPIRAQPAQPSSVPSSDDIIDLTLDDDDDDQGASLFTPAFPVKSIATSPSYEPLRLKVEGEDSVSTRPAKSAPESTVSTSQPAKKSTTPASAPKPASKIATPSQRIPLAGESSLSVPAGPASETKAALVDRPQGNDSDDEIQNSTQAEYRAAVRSKRSKNSEFSRSQSFQPPPATYIHPHESRDEEPILEPISEKERFSQTLIEDNPLDYGATATVEEDLESESLVYPDEEPAESPRSIPAAQDIAVKVEDVEMAVQEVQETDEMTQVDSVQRDATDQDMNELPGDLGFTEDVLRYLFMKKKNKEKWRCKICDSVSGSARLVYRNNLAMMLHLANMHEEDVPSFQKLQHQIDRFGVDSEVLAKFLA
ncbi:hypothetical protein GYMLUDRAFT_44217 [Collybiopsis luxurians FD-317 M1]|uniref:Uncharacterized protein n=1 Tax=Collybiopsis luxurians FD-317 M1 TaxID=944289 RepID=A0A0D0B885_9AGAR|nr:hypothetical protein GYMLUDRAFT_44217 [Collybiopsis luxurians FD-317 M1]